MAVGDPGDVVTLLDEVVGDMRRIIEDRVRSDSFFWRYYILVGPAGAVQFAYMEESEGVFRRFGVDGKTGVDLGYHSAVPLGGDDSPMEECDLLPQGHCWYNGSGMHADWLLKRWAEAGWDDGLVWGYLAGEYRSMAREQEGAGDVQT